MVAVESGKKNKTDENYSTNAANDSAPWDKDFDFKMFSNFFRISKSYSTEVDMPHNCKYEWCQAIGLNYVFTIGKHVIDVAMLSMIEEELFGVKNWSRDTRILQLASFKTCMLILDSPSKG